MNNKLVYREQEKILLAELVKEHGRTIENKRIDGATVADKNKSWELLASSYNSQPNVYVLRTAKQLKKIWVNLKQRYQFFLLDESIESAMLDESLDSNLLDGRLPSITEAAVPSISPPTVGRLPHDDKKSAESVLNKKFTQSIRQEKELFLRKKRVAEEELGKISKERELVKVKMELEIKTAKHEEKLAALKFTKEW
ncbi:unnamed protein product [Psylliodes chrysocephalus]|uniref:Regulatory protein zeste n=1 Tax=Psylliodes chrysocephalus TaxID=3402493 RepID=A0A9P0CYV1_9CUCU|nr:unnamed protein product [Psylliodes chrysocephala]